MRTVVFALIGLGLFFLGLWTSPDRLSALGIMDASLNHPLELVRETTLFEVRASKIAFLCVGAFIICICAFRRQVNGTRAMKRLERAQLRFPEAYEARIETFFNSAFFIGMAFFLLGLGYIAFGDRLFSQQALAQMNREDGVIEYGSAILLLLASVFAFRVAWSGNGRRAVRVFHGFLCVLFFAMCGEEISWGQRIIGFETSEAIGAINAQNEMNLHNMFGYLFDHLFIALFFAWGCILPVLYATVRPIRQLVRLIGLPVPSYGLAVFMLAATLLQEQVTGPLIGVQAGLRVPELREFLSAIAFLLLMFQSFRGLVRDETPHVSSSGVTAGR